jgi:hypothetical protein
MQLFGLGKKKADDTSEGEPKSPKADIKQQLGHVLKFAERYETTIVALAIAALLSVTSLRMLHYMDPQIDDAKVQESLAKNKKSQINPKVVEKIKQLQDNGATPPSTAVGGSGRTNPFTE